MTELKSGTYYWMDDFDNRHALFSSREAERPAAIAVSISPELVDKISSARALLEPAQTEGAVKVISLTLHHAQLFEFDCFPDMTVTVAPVDSYVEFDNNHGESFTIALSDMHPSPPAEWQADWVVEGVEPDTSMEP